MNKVGLNFNFIYLKFCFNLIFCCAIFLIIALLLIEFASHYCIPNNCARGFSATDLVIISQPQCSSSLRWVYFFAMSFRCITP